MHWSSPVRNGVCAAVYNGILDLDCRVQIITITSHFQFCPEYSDCADSTFCHRFVVAQTAACYIVFDSVRPVTKVCWRGARWMTGFRQGGASNPRTGQRGVVLNSVCPARVVDGFKTFTHNISISYP